MNKLPPPSVPGDSEAERMSNAIKMVLAVPSDAVTKEKKRLKRARVRKARQREAAR